MSSINNTQQDQSLSAIKAMIEGGNVELLQQLQERQALQLLQELQKQLSTPQLNIGNIDLNDKFNLTDIRKKNEEHAYKHDVEMINDLSKVVRYIEDGKGCYLQKVYDGMLKTYRIKYITRAAMKETLQEIIITKEKKKRTAYNVLLEHLSKLTIQGVRFHCPDDENIYSLFHGYKYNIKETHDESIIKAYIDFIKEVICNNKDNINEYILNWIAYIVQNPGKRTNTALVLKGLQGIGKGTFTDVLCEMLSRYSAPNITDIKEITGDYNSVIEGKKLLILNELKNVGDDRLANFDALKSRITDDYIRVGEKYEPGRYAENVANYIFCTNNAYPVKIERSDRRYVVLEVSGSKKNNFDYWNSIYASCKGSEFYDNLTTYFAKRDITKFDPRNIPTTEAKEDMIEVSKNPVELWICDKYDKLISDEGIAVQDRKCPEGMSVKEFNLKIKPYCIYEKKQVKGYRYWGYWLKDECKTMFRQTQKEDTNIEYVGEEEEEDINNVQ